MIIITGNKIHATFLTTQPIPEDRGSVDPSFYPVREEIYRRGKSLMEEIEESGWKAEKTVKNLYDSCMNQQNIEKLGLEPITDQLAILGGWPVAMDWQEDNFNWAEYAIKSTELGLHSLDFIISHGVIRDVKKISRRVLTIDQPSLGLDRKYLIKGIDNKDVQHYYEYMVESATLMGATKSKARKHMRDVLLFEIALANASTSMEKRRDPNSRYNPTTLGGLKSLPDLGISFHEFFNRIFQSGGARNVKFDENEKVVVADPEFMDKLTPILEGTHKIILANYLGWRVFMSAVSYLHQAARALDQNFRRNLLGIKKPKPDWKRCLSIVGFNGGLDGGLSLAVGSMYVRKHFKPKDKKSVVKLISHITNAFGQLLRKVKWMDESTRQKAKKKLKLIKQRLAYPDEMLDQKMVDRYYQPLENMSSQKYFQNALRVSKFHTEKHYNRLREAYDPNHWTEFCSVAIVNAYYDPNVNTVSLPAGILQGAFFNSGRPQSMNFAAIGGVIGHELTHGFDDQGRMQDSEGKIKS